MLSSMTKGEIVDEIVIDANMVLMSYQLLKMLITLDDVLACGGLVFEPTHMKEHSQQPQ